MPRLPPWRGRPFAPQTGTDLCDVAQIPTDNGVEIVLGEGPHAFRLVLFHTSLAAAAVETLLTPDIVAYVNECPHAGIGLDFSDQVFCVYEIDGQRDVMCPHHSAMFHLSDGRCYDGPCIGESLVSVPIRIENGKVKVA